MEWTQEQLHEIDLITSMQNVLSELKTDNSDEYFNFLLNSEYLNSKVRFIELVRNIYEWSIYHPQKIYIYADLLKYLDNNSINIHEICGQVIISIAEHIIFKNRSSPIEAAPLHLLVQCYLRNIVPIQIIITNLSQSLTEKRHSKSTLSAYFMFFAPEVESFAPELYENFIHFLEINDCDKGNHKICSYFDFFKANNWSKLKLYRSHIHCMNPILRLLLDDDVENLKQMNAHPYFDINQNLTELPPLSPFYYLSNGPSLICAAAALNAVGCFKYLMLMNASICSQSQTEQGIAAYAAIGGNLEIIRIVEQAGADFNGTIHMSATFHHDDLFFWLHESKFPNLLLPSPQNKSVLGQAASSNNITILKYMIDQGYDMNRIDEHGECPLERAAYFGCNEFAKILLWLPNIDVNARTKTPPLCAAAFNGNVDIVVELLKRPFIDVNIPNGKKQTPLTLAASSAHYTTFSVLFDVPGVDYNIKDIMRSNLIHSIAMQNDIRIASMALKICDSSMLNESINNKGTPFHIACMMGNIDVVKLFLLRNDLNLNTQTTEGFTPLDQALRFYQIDIANLLISSTNAKATKIRLMQTKLMKKSQYLNNIMSEIFKAINYYIQKEDSKILNNKTENMIIIPKGNLEDIEDQQMNIISRK